MEETNKNKDRLDLFFGTDDFDQEIEYGMEYYENDTRFRITLHRVDVINSKTHKLYGQAKPGEKQFLPAVELNVWVNFSGENTYNKKEMGLKTNHIESFLFNVYDKELDKHGIELRRGDFFAYHHGDRLRYYEIDKVSYVNEQSQTMAGQKPYFKRVTGVPVKEDIIKL